MVGEAEICGIPVAFFFLALWYLAYSYHKRQQEEEKRRKREEPRKRRDVKWTGKVVIPFGIDDCRAFFREALCGHAECRIVHETSTYQLFKRGDTSITTLPADRDVEWFEFPLTIAITYTRESDGTSAVMKYEAPKAMKFNPECATIFRDNSSEEVEGLVEAAKEWAQEVAREQGAQEEAAQTGWEAEEDDEKPKAEPQPEPVQACTSDFQELGLSPGATWSEVQAAYRSICLQYHPDTFPSQNIPRHVMKLAISKFKTATAAYQRLRSQITGQRTTESTDLWDTVRCSNCGQNNRVSGQSGVYRCGRCGHVVRGEAPQPEREEAYEEQPHEYETEYQDDYEEEHPEPESGQTTEAFCKVCPTGLVVIRIEGTSKAEVTEWYGTADAECRYCGQCFMVRDLVDLDEVLRHCDFQGR